MKANRRGICLWRLALALVFLSAALSVTGAQAESKLGDALTNRQETLLNDKSGLPTSEANAVAQTEDGYLWIGSYGGLMRYDGKQFRNYSLEPNGLGNSGIRALLADGVGLWVGTNDKGIFYYESGQFTPCLPAQDTPSYHSVRCFAKGGDRLRGYLLRPGRCRPG